MPRGVLPRWRLRLGRAVRQPWFRATLYCAAGVLTALVAAVAQPHVPEDFAYAVGADAAGAILNVLASSMLAATTFSLTVMVTALGSASAVTPRATELLAQDRVAQSALATFLGAFLFAVVGIIALATGIYGRGGRVVLLGATVAVIVLIVVTLLRWMQQLTRLGRVGATLRSVEEAAVKAMRLRREAPLMGGVPRLPGERAPCPVFPATIGYVQHIDMASLDAALGEGEERVLDVDALPGAFVDPSRPLCWVPEGLDEAAVGRVRDAFLVGEAREFDHDPRFGLVVLAEIASRALPPTVADSGTAIAVLGTQLRVLWEWAQPQEEGEAGQPAGHPRLRVPALSPKDMLDDAFAPIARDGAGLIEVQLRLQKALHSLAALAPETFGEAARHQARLALDHAEQALATPDDRERLRAATLSA
ncbi:DUF2254 domain-containing protein [Roseomonas sp. OT10]|uniref:DUF2254 domain-containing protein n=1 Tax=Roseomonas cutis TaxID=2897332 RepID=UPI001E4729AD|nr:DUF2254 domain-containing protein [Roseomonas sp. OT10]UFN48758.1 DUF2254 domain-containing protein [Roseomonas sp. OT10]